MNEIVFRTKSSGLHEKWLRMQYEEFESLIQNNTKHLRYYSDREIETFSFIFNIYSLRMDSRRYCVGKILQIECSHFKNDN